MPTYSDIIEENLGTESKWGKYLVKRHKDSFQRVWETTSHGRYMLWVFRKKFQGNRKRLLKCLVEAINKCIKLNSPFYDAIIDFVHKDAEFLFKPSKEPTLEFAICSILCDFFYEENNHLFLEDVITYVIAATRRDKRKKITFRDFPHANKIDATFAQIIKRYFPKCPIENPDFYKVAP